MPILNDKEIGNRITQLRDELKFKSTREFAMDAKLDVSYFSKIEKGQKPISDNYLDALAGKYGISKDWLLFGRGEMFGTNVPHETKSDKKSSVPQNPNDLQIAVRELSEATNRHSITDDRNSKNIERLLVILEKAYGIKRDVINEDEDERYIPPGDKYGETLETKKKKNRR